MPALAPPEPKNAPIEVCPLRGLDDARLAQGEAGVALELVMQQASIHWEDREGRGHVRAELGEIHYVAAPPQAVFQKHAQYRYAGEGLPLAYEFDEESE